MNASVSGHRTLAVIPVYGEENRIGQVISGFKSELVDEINLVLDSPNQALMDEIRINGARIDVPVNIIRNPERRGIGYAIRKGIQYAINQGFDIIVVMAGNGKDDPREIPRLLKPIVQEGYDYVQGSRFLRGGRRVKNPILRGIFSRLYPFIWTLFTNVRCTDVTNGFRAYKTSIFKNPKIDIRQSWLDSYQLEYYIHYKVLTLGYRAKEAPVSKVYEHRHKGGYSKINPLVDWWQIVAPLIYLRLGVRK